MKLNNTGEARETRINQIDRMIRRRSDSRRYSRGVSELNALGEAVLDGKARQLDAVRDTELVEHVGEVVLHGIRTDGELLRDVVVGGSHHDGGDDVELTRREAEGRLVSRGATRSEG